MSQYNDTGYGTILLSATIPQHARVTAAGALANATTQHVGTARVAGVSGDTVGLVYANKQGTTKMIAGAAITAGVKVYTAANGKVSSTQATGAFLCGIAMEAASADGNIIEVQQIVGDTAGS
jgi:hypothetical protein